MGIAWCFWKQFWGCSGVIRRSTRAIVFESCYLHSCKCHYSMETQLRQNWCQECQARFVVDCLLCGWKVTAWLRDAAAGMSHQHKKLLWQQGLSRCELAGGGWQRMLNSSCMGVQVASRLGIGVHQPGFAGVFFSHCCDCKGKPSA